jgi:hypothetical protein
LAVLPCQTFTQHTLVDRVPDVRGEPGDAAGPPARVVEPSLPSGSVALSTTPRPARSANAWSRQLVSGQQAWSTSASARVDHPGQTLRVVQVGQVGGHGEQHLVAAGRQQAGRTHERELRTCWSEGLGTVGSGYQPRSASRCGCGMSSTLMPTIA